MTTTDADDPHASGGIAGARLGGVSVTPLFSVTVFPTAGAKVASFTPKATGSSDAHAMARPNRPSGVGVFAAKARKVVTAAATGTEREPGRAVAGLSGANGVLTNFPGRSRWW